MDYFPTAHRIGMSYIKTWLPNGRQETNEWVCINPTRNDNKPGSFKINLTTGEWADFADDVSGKDSVSLYAYLNRQNLEQKVRNYNNPPKNFEGCVQLESAKEILEKHDPTYFPSTNDKFNVPKQKNTGRWDGWIQQTRGIKDPPSPDNIIIWASQNTDIGEEFKRWDGFKDKNGNILFYVVRHINGNKKSDIPYTLWSDGKEYKWRMKGWKEQCQKGFKIPLYRLPDILEKANAPILIVEGQKNAEDGFKILGDEWIVSTAYGSNFENIDCDPLIGRTIWYWFDPDRAGRKKMQKIKILLEKMECKVNIIHSPVGEKPGYDISDAIKDGWKKEDIIKYLNAEKKEEFIDDGLPFKIVGVTATDIYFFPKESKCLINYKKQSLTKGAMMTLMDREIWGDFFAKHDGGIAWDAASNFILRRAAISPFYKNTMLRGSGAWKDNGNLVIHTGKNLIIDRKEIDLYDFESKYIYEKRDYIPYSLSGCQTSESKIILEACKLLNLREKNRYLLLAGWILLAPYGGALEWRSKVWLTGPKGSGKTWVLENIIYPLIGDYGHIAPGTGSEAAIRRQAGTSSLPNVHDEMESDNKTYAENINNILMFYRVGSSGENGGIIKVGNDGEVQKWVSQCMALFASIGASISHSADKSRISVMTLMKNMAAKGKINFKKLKEIIKTFTSEWVKLFHGRTLLIWEEIEKTVKMFNHITGEILDDQRDGDQIGTLLAGAYMLNHDKCPIASECKKWLEEIDINSFKNNIKHDEEICLEEILHHEIEISDSKNRQKQTIGFFLSQWYNIDSFFKENTIDKNTCVIEENYIKSHFVEIGLKPVKVGKDLFLHLAIGGHPGIKKILTKTSWINTYDEMLKRLDCFVEEKGPGRFGSLQKRFLVLDVNNIFDEVPF